MAIDRLYTLRELSEVTGFTAEALRELVASGELAVVRRTAHGKIRVAESAWNAWQATHSTAVKQVPVVVQLNPPKSAPVNKPAAVDVGEFIPSGFKSPFARSA